MKPFLYTLLLLTLSGCTYRDTILEQQCVNKGYKKGTEEYATCMTNGNVTKDRQHILRYREGRRWEGKAL